ncbi:hypothetical protein K9N68_37440 (plasmid) [Kovacikia minuta CCNUW1]|uniref:hypothetical protein n=1 Tax=Kovacikia minuta TaxID=2931930 RepID=UPI001CCA8D1B|nr:hypothetical protein [Kovacikia minuta]UBF29898.1 hypothetical protein K9N68_37440 [Kovacikia minuta CCNUW1]
MTQLHAINQEQKLYVLTCGDGYTCLGFGVAARKAKAVAKWLKLPIPSNLINEGTKEGFAEYQQIMLAGADHHGRTGKRCEAELVQQLKGLEGHWVWVQTHDEEIEIFKVGKSTGWFPCHLKITPPGLSGGDPIFETSFKRVELLLN